MIFSERYKDLVNALEGNLIIDKICGNNIDISIRKNLVYLLSTFNEPKIIQLDRYDTSNIAQTDAFFKHYPNSYTKGIECKLIISERLWS